MDCPYCSCSMRFGRLTAYGVGLTSVVAWEPNDQGLGGTHRVLWPGLTGFGSRPSYRCDACGAVLTAPDPPDPDPLVDNTPGSDF